MDFETSINTIYETIKSLKKKKKKKKTYLPSLGYFNDPHAINGETIRLGDAVPLLLDIRPISESFITTALKLTQIHVWNMVRCGRLWHERVDGSETGILNCFVGSEP